MADETDATTGGGRTPKGASAAGRQDGDYTVEFTNPPKGGPIPQHRPFEDRKPTTGTNSDG